MNYTHGGSPEKNTKRGMLSLYGVRGEGKAYPTGETPLGALPWVSRRDLPLRDVRYEAPGRWSESDRIGGEKSDDGGTPSSSFRFMEFVGAVVKLQS